MNFLNILLIFTAVTGGIYDLTCRKIPNWLTFGSFFLALSFNLLFFKTIDSIFNCLLGFVLGLALLIIPYILGGMGAGDVKFLAAIGSLVGVRDVVSIFLYSAVCGMILGILWLAFNPKRLKFLVVTGQISPVVDNKQKVPYGIAILMGTLLYVIPGINNFICNILLWK